MNEAPEKIITVGASMGGFAYFRNLVEHLDALLPVAVMFCYTFILNTKASYPAYWISKRIWRSSR
jgi:hypothetical protein